jgi:chorismate synthase
MASNSLGKIFTFTGFGESHGKGIGVVIDGMPAGVKIDMNLISLRLSERKPGQSKLVTQRKEEDNFEILSGIFEGKSTGAPICVWIQNTDAKSEDYDLLKDKYRPSHADFTYDKKYGIRDYRGGGRSSARTTAGWVVAGTFAEMLLKAVSDINVISFVKQIYNITIPENTTISQGEWEKQELKCPDKKCSEEMKKAIEHAKLEGDSLGGIIGTHISNCPVGLGEPLFGKFQAQLGAAILSLNAVKGISFGGGFGLTSKKGSETNDEWIVKNNKTETVSNHSGGLLGGISNGMDILFDVAFKPTASINKVQNSIDKDNQQIRIQSKGRHDPCVVPRAVPIVRALTYAVLADLWLQNLSSRIK